MNLQLLVSRPPLRQRPLLQHSIITIYFSGVLRKTFTADSCIATQKYILIREFITPLLELSNSFEMIRQRICHPKLKLPIVKHPFGELINVN